MAKKLVKKNDKWVRLSVKVPKGWKSPQRKAKEAAKVGPGVGVEHLRPPKKKAVKKSMQKFDPTLEYPGKRKVVKKAVKKVRTGKSYRI